MDAKVEIEEMLPAEEKENVPNKQPEQIRWNRRGIHVLMFDEWIDNLNVSWCYGLSGRSWNGYKREEHIKTKSNWITFFILLESLKEYDDHRDDDHEDKHYYKRDALGSPDGKDGKDVIKDEKKDEKKD